MAKIKQLEKELKSLEKIEQKRLVKIRGKQREAELRRKIRELKYADFIEARRRAAATARKIGVGARRVGRISREALKKLQERERRLLEIQKGKRRKGKPPIEESYSDRLGKAFGF